MREPLPPHAQLPVWNDGDNSSQLYGSKKAKVMIQSIWLNRQRHAVSMVNDPIIHFSDSSRRLFSATKPLTTRETEAMKQAARSKRQSSRFRTAPDGRLMIDMEDEEGDNNHQQESEDDEDDRREDLKGLMETLSLSQQAKNKRKRALEHDDDEDEDDNHQHEDKQSSRSKYRSNGDLFETC